MFVSRMSAKINFNVFNCSSL